MHTLKQKPRKGISRIDSSSTHGWFVRGYKNSQVFSKLFSDRKLGGKTKALVAAKDYRDKLYVQISKMKPANQKPVLKAALKAKPTPKKATLKPKVTKTPRRTALLKRLEKVSRRRK